MSDSLYCLAMKLLQWWIVEFGYFFMESGSFVIKSRSLTSVSVIESGTGAFLGTTVIGMGKTRLESEVRRTSMGFPGRKIAARRNSLPMSMPRIAL